MPYQMTVGLRVTDQTRYAAYRNEMRPLLEGVGGSFRFDCEVAQAWKSAEGEAGVNRLFVIEFPSREAKNQFFGNPQYAEIRGRLFVPSVASTSIIAEYEAAG